MFYIFHICWFYFIGILGVSNCFLKNTCSPELLTVLIHTTIIKQYIFPCCIFVLQIVIDVFFGYVHTFAPMIFLVVQTTLTIDPIWWILKNLSQKFTHSFFGLNNFQTKKWIVLETYSSFRCLATKLPKKTNICQASISMTNSGFSNILAKVSSMLFTEIDPMGNSIKYFSDDDEMYWKYLYLITIANCRHLLNIFRIILVLDFTWW